MGLVILTSPHIDQAVL